MGIMGDSKGSRMNEINMDETLIKVVWLCFWWGLIGIIMIKK
jgi:hypothetical protein